MLLTLLLTLGAPAPSPAPAPPPAAKTVLADLPTNPLEQTITVKTALLGVDYSPDGTKVATCGLGRDVTIWNAATGKATFTLKGHTDDVVCVKFSPNGRYLASGGVDKALILWDALTGDLIRRNTDHTDYVRDVTFSPDSKLVASAGWDGQAIVWETFSGQKVARLGRAAAAAPTTTYERERNNKGRSEAITSVAFNNTGTELLTASGDHSVRGWDTDGWKEKYSLDGHTDEVWDARYSPNGQVVVSGGWDNTARVWNLKTRALIYTLPAHVSDVWSTAFSPDGQLIATAGGDRKIKIWDMASGLLVCELVANGTPDAHTAEVENVTFSPDGRHLASVSRDGTLKIWRVPTIEDRLAAYTEYYHFKWAKKGEYEKTEEYGKRMDTRADKLTELREEARKKIVGTYALTALWQDAELGAYNADAESFAFTFRQFPSGKYVLKVPPREAAGVKEAFAKATYRGAEFDITPEGTVELKQATVAVKVGDANRAYVISR